MNEPGPGTREIIEVAREAERRLNSPIELPVGEVIGYVDTHGELRTLDLRQYAEKPEARSGTYQVADADSFKQALKFWPSDQLTIWVQHEGREVVAVLNDAPGGDNPTLVGWGDHRVVYRLRQSPEWLHWLDHDGELMAQDEFADHIENGLPDIAIPDGAELLEMVQNLHGTTSVVWRNKVNVNSGAITAEYVEEIDGQTSTKTNGSIEIPRGFTLGLAPILGEDKREIDASLRWKVRAGSILLGYKLARPERVLLECVEAIADGLRAEFGDERVFLGVPAHERR